MFKSSLKSKALRTRTNGFLSKSFSALDRDYYCFSFLWSGAIGEKEAVNKNTLYHLSIVLFVESFLRSKNLVEEET